MRGLGSGRSHSDPGEVSGEIVPAVTARPTASLSFFVGEMQPFMAGEEIDPMDLACSCAHDVLHELKRLDHAMSAGVILVRERRVAGEVEVPVFGMMEVGEASLYKGADKVQRQS